MSVRKYLFWMNQEGIRTYKVTQKGTFELMKPSGKDVYSGSNIKNFYEWFHKSAAITEDEYIDFCFLSDSEIKSALFDCDYAASTKSSWDKQEIEIFCDKYMNVKTYEVFYAEDKSFICQSGNVYDKKDIKKLYMKCVPEFSIETKEKVEAGSEETSVVNLYFIEKLKSLDS